MFFPLARHLASGVTAVAVEDCQTAKNRKKPYLRRRLQSCKRSEATGAFDGAGRPCQRESLWETLRALLRGMTRISEGRPVWRKTALSARLSLWFVPARNGPR